MAAQPARGHGAHDIEQTDHPQCPAADFGGEAAIDQIRGQMQSDESELEPASEETQYEQDIGAVPEGFGQGLTIGLGLQVAWRTCSAYARVGSRCSNRKCERKNQKQKAGKDFKRHSPANRVDQAHSEWREQELPE